MEQVGRFSHGDWPRSLAGRARSAGQMGSGHRWAGKQEAAPRSRMGEQGWGRAWECRAVTVWGCAGSRSQLCCIHITAKAMTGISKTGLGAAKFQRAYFCTSVPIHHTRAGMGSVKRRR